jgi:hypothetical protein
MQLLQSASGNATELADNDGPFVIVNMSAWTSVEVLRNNLSESPQLSF